MGSHSVFHRVWGIAGIIGLVSICGPIVAVQAGTSDILRILKTPFGKQLLATDEWYLLSTEVLGRPVQSLKTAEEIGALTRQLESRELDSFVRELEMRLSVIEREFIYTRATHGPRLNTKELAEVRTLARRELRYRIEDSGRLKFLVNEVTVSISSRQTLGSRTKKFMDPDVSITEPVKFTMPGLEVASVEDASRSTGATLFRFPEGASVAYDARGGSVASSETTLLDAGSYSNEIDAIVFAGGSTMGLAAGDGVRRVIFGSRAGSAGAFDLIPSVPTAVVYDFGAREAVAGTDKLIYPTAEMGEQLMKRLGSVFAMGRAGAGRFTTANKIAQEGGRIWGGQGAAFGEYRWGKIFTAVIVNPVGDIRMAGMSVGETITKLKLPGGSLPKQNTTLSIVVTDVPLDRNQLKRLSTTVHTNMAETISPFHTYHDGDINFAASVARKKAPTKNEALEWTITVEASRLMQQAIINSVRTANAIAP